MEALKHVHESWKIVPKAAIDELREKEGKNLSLLKSILAKIKKEKFKGFLRAVFDFIWGAVELSGETFFFLRPYWQEAIQAIWRVYWALVLDRIPAEKDILVVAAVYY